MMWASDNFETDLVIAFESTNNNFSNWIDL